MHPLPEALRMMVALASPVDHADGSQRVTTAQVMRKRTNCDVWTGRGQQIELVC